MPRLTPRVLVQTKYRDLGMDLKTEEGWVLPVGVAGDAGESHAAMTPRGPHGCLLLLNVAAGDA
jgi:hypothetical protein